MTVKITIFRLQFLFSQLLKNCNGDKKAKKNDCYFNRYGCTLYRNKARFSESQIFVTMKKYFFLNLCFFYIYFA